MKKLILGTFLAISIVTVAYASVKKVYIGSHSAGYAHYVVECTNGQRYTDITHKSDGWHQGSFMSSMGDSYRGLSINEVANKLCR